ncbi:DUF2514 domain-containing protein [Pseudomonas amygdali]|uniref:DUF2514 domain-containing protein n=1 Tax=Pseudomonas amygdali TaxID=47877 RepID=UPI001FB7112E|nr:DUF2514 domain-containing protein [Pseudomonas amygdali]UPT34698.1 DUF2514 domain-containing protein [Pseudomonas amygdali pv. loropetali]
MNTASIIYLLTAVLGFALAVAGVYVLLGVGWALLAAASSCFAAAAFIRRGLATTTTEYRTEEQRRQKAANQVANHARQEQTAALTDAAVADAAGDRLRVQAGKLAAATSCAPGDTGAAERGKAATRAAMVLSELLSRSDSRAGELAKYADSARIAGLACNRFVEELSNTTNSARP